MPERPEASRRREPGLQHLLTPADQRPIPCDDFTRAGLLRASLASALPGQGLPILEPGTPAPAGTGLSRRSFLARTGGLALAVYGASALSPQAFDAGIASAAAAAPGERILVSVSLTGGFDGLSLLAPVEDARYQAARPTLRIQPGNTAGAFDDDTRLQWHPKAGPLRDLHAAGRLTVIPAVGYAGPNQSHFTSRHFWEVGATDPFGQVGWLGKYLDLHGAPDNPLQGLSLSSSLSPMLAPSNAPVAAISEPENFGLRVRDIWNERLLSGLWDGLAAMSGVPTADPGLAQVQKAMASTAKLRGTLGQMQGTSSPFGASVEYPKTGDAFPRRLSALAQMIDLGMPLKCVAIEGNGAYDVHDAQDRYMTQNIELLAQSLAAFQADLEARGIADRVIVLVWSEFGRRVCENGTGTDHGSGGLAMLMGSSVASGMVGEFPGLASAGVDDEQNLRANVDFRGLYASLAEQWLGVDADGIVAGAKTFDRYAIIRS